MGANVQNGNVISIIRIVLCAMICLASLGLGAWLMTRGIELPVAWWGIAAIGIGGVAGADVLEIIRRNRGAKDE